MGTLFMVGTPIGNLKDITLRALEILGSVDTVFCEDTRRTRKLLTAHGISTKVGSIRAQNEEKEAGKVLEILKNGGDAAYVSDAGTPGISDPGAVLARIVRENGFTVSPIPGPSAFGSLCSVSGFQGKMVLFEGFLSPKKGKRKNRLKELFERQEAFLLYESPYRILKLLEDITDVSPDRKILIGREMTKIHEEILEGTAGELLEMLTNRDKILGEFSVLVSGKKKG